MRDLVKIFASRRVVVAAVGAGVAAAGVAGVSVRPDLAAALADLLAALAEALVAG